MRSVLYILNLPRSIPVCILFLLAKGTEKDRLLQDMGVSRGLGSFWVLHKSMVDSRYFRRIFLFRMKRAMGKVAIISKFFYPTAQDFEINGDIGGGFHLYHGYGTIVFAEKMGANCSVYQHVTIGRGKTINGRNIPVIGDNVQIFANATVIGGITIGNNCKIGAGAVVISDMPDNSVAVGVPARIIVKERDNR